MNKNSTHAHLNSIIVVGHVVHNSTAPLNHTEWSKWICGVFSEGFDNSVAGTDGVKPIVVMMGVTGESEEREGLRILQKCVILNAIIEE